MSIKSFKNKATKDIAKKVRSVSAAAILPIELHGMAHRRIVMLDNLSSIKDLDKMESCRVEKVDGKGVQRYRLSIDERFSVHFRWADGRSSEVEIVDEYMESIG